MNNDKLVVWNSTVNAAYVFVCLVCFAPASCKSSKSSRTQVSTIQAGTAQRIFHFDSYAKRDYLWLSCLLECIRPLILRPKRTEIVKKKRLLNPMGIYRNSPMRGSNPQPWDLCTHLRVSRSTDWANRASYRGFDCWKLRAKFVYMSIAALQDSVSLPWLIVRL